MEPPSEFEYHHQQQHNRHPSSVYSQQQRGRNWSRIPIESRDTSGGGSSSGASQSKSNTPRRKGNPQSSSPIIERQQPEKNILTPSPSLAMKHSSSSSSSDFKSTGLLTPLSTLSSILTTHSAHSHTALQLFRQAHALHRHASERTYLAMEKLRAAQAEVEHATTAQEFAKEELDKAAVQKTEAHDAMVAMSKRVRALSKGLKNERVRLVGLTQNVHWNGRLGTILKLITDGEDAGRWKVRLDQEWRGRDADGKIVHRSDETISDGSDEHEEGTTTNMVVAKAENLELIDEGDIDLFHQQQQYQALSMSSSRSRSASSKRLGSQSAEEPMMYNSPDRRSRDPLISRRHDPTAAASKVVTPEQSRSPRKQIVPSDYIKSEDGRYRESLPHHNYHSPQRQQSIQPSTNRLQKPSTNHSSKQPTHQVHPSSNVPRNPQRSGAGTVPVTKYFSPIRRSPSNDSTRLSSAFSQMLLSPVSFTPVSFHPDSSENFEQWVRQDEGDNNGNNTTRQMQKHGGQQQQQQQPPQQLQPQYQHGQKPVLQNNNSTSGSDSFWCAGSYFDEVTSLDKDTFPYNEGKNCGKYYEWDDNASDPKLQQIPSTEEMYSPPTANDNDHGHGLPHIVVLPAPEDEYDNAFAPESSPPYCVGVQNAGYSHVNGVYLLAYSKDDEARRNEEGTKTAPLYFKDGPPTLLSDNRYYDMCILRINCPDSPDHVIWFLARVDIDPDCLDVKFSDCYYYCRMLRNDDGCGGEREGGCDSPPSSGWHLPKLPPGVDMLSIAKSGSFSTMETASNDGEGGYGLGIASRPAMLSYSQRGLNEDGKRTIQQTNSRFLSPGNNSATGSKYSI